MALPEAPTLLLDHDGLQRRNDLPIAFCPIQPRLVIRRPRQPGYLASLDDRQTVVFRKYSIPLDLSP